jgi:heme oxygenase
MNPVADVQLTAAGTALESLRAATRAAHASIETVPALSRLLAPNLGAADYVDTLRLLHAFYAGIEPILGRLLQGKSRAAALLDGVRLAAIAEDIAWFGVTPLPPLRPESPPVSIAAALGALYVIEGSNLGGRVIGRHVSKTLGVVPGSGGSFHCGLTADEARRRWQVLQEVLRLEIDLPGLPLEPLTRTALATFRALECWMRRGHAHDHPAHLEIGSHG